MFYSTNSKVQIASTQLSIFSLETIIPEQFSQRLKKIIAWDFTKYSYIVFKKIQL